MISSLKAQPDKMTFASSGSGSSDHLTAELFWQQSGTKGVHVPYKGGAPAVADLLGGQVDASFQNINAIIQHVPPASCARSPSRRRKRSPLLPDVPTLAESGVQGRDVYSWQAVAAPKGLPMDVKSKLHAALVASLNDAQVKEKFVAVGFEVVANTPEQFEAFQKSEFDRWKQLIQSRNITAD